MSIDLTVSVDPAGVATVREASFVGANVDETDNLAFATFAPAGADSTKYVASSASATFKTESK